MEPSADKIVSVPIELKFSDDNSRLVAVVGLGDAISQSGMAVRLREVEKDCQQTIEACRSILKQVSGRNPDAFLRWDVGNLVVKFIDKQKERGFVVLNYIDTFAQGLAIAKSYLEAILRFRERYAQKSRIHGNISWGKYYELVWFNDLNRMREIERQLVLGEIKSTKVIQEIRRKANVKQEPQIGSKMRGNLLL